MVNTTSASTSSRKSILYVDAFDSFSNNVISMLEEVLNVSVRVLTVDAEWPNGDMRGFLRGFDAVVLGPGPGDPQCKTDVGIMNDLWTLDGDDIVPILGICLGFQSLCLNQGLAIKRLPCPLHGQVHRLSVVDKDIFSGFNNFEVTLYHSLYASTGFEISRDESSRSNCDEPKDVKDLSILAWLTVSEEGGVFRTLPMAVRHNIKPFWGFQFHPESCKSDAKACKRLLQEWWVASSDFNRKSKRVVQSSPWKTTISSPQVPQIQLSLSNVLDRLTAGSSRECFYQKLPLHGIHPEHLFELFNIPGSPSVLFQSNGRYSIISIQSAGTWRLEYYLSSETFTIEQPSPAAEKENHSGVSLETFWQLLKTVMDNKEVTSGPEEVPFWGGFLGYFSYEIGLAGLPHPRTSPVVTSRPENSSSAHDCRNTAPDASLLWVERNIVVDNLSQMIYVQSTREIDNQPGGWLEITYKRLQQLHDQKNQEDIEVGLKSAALEQCCLLTSAERNLVDNLLQGSTIKIPDEAIYKQKIAECQDEMRAGESYELCLTGDTTITLPAIADPRLRRLRPWLIYKKLKTYNPAAYSAYGNLGKAKIASSSPECFLQWDRISTLEMKPMKGTVRKSPGMTLEKAKEILATKKEMAENLMIADLIRHDLYGICGSGNVYVEKLLDVEDYGRVYSMVTHVKGIVNRAAAKEINHQSSMASYGLTTLQKTLPPGSMTGAPKERSCMHLERIEGWNRGIYSGVMGFLDLGGSGSFSVLIRTAFSISDHEDAASATEPEVWHMGAGGAVTVLSTPQGEWDEMITKLRTVVSIFDPEK